MMKKKSHNTFLSIFTCGMCDLFICRKFNVQTGDKKGSLSLPKACTLGRCTVSFVVKFYYASVHGRLQTNISRESGVASLWAEPGVLEL